MPGVSISTAVRTGPANPGVAPASTFFVVGETERGTDTDAVLITNLTQYESYFGGYESNKYTYQQVRTFFEEGGARAYVARVSAADGVAASKEINAQGSAPGIIFTAIGKGEWGNDLYVSSVLTSSIFSVTVYYGGSTDEDIVFSGVGYTSLSDAIEKMSASATLAKYCTVSIASGATLNSLLGTTSAVALENGSDGSVGVSDFVLALDHFGEEFGPGAVAIPGLTSGSGDDEIWDAMKAHCIANNRVAICSFASGTSASTAASASDAYGSSDNSGHEYLAFYHPWVRIPSGTGVTLTVPPDAYVAAKRSQLHNSSGPWSAYAGISSTSSFVTGLESAVNRASGDTLDDSRVNAIRIINNQVRIYGARSHSTNTAQWRFITHRETINYILYLANEALEPLIFSSINGRKEIYANVKTALKNVMEPIRVAGGLFEGSDQNGALTDYGYTVKCDDSINTLSDLEAGQIHARLGVRVSSVGDKISLTVTKSNLTSTLI